MKRLRTAPHFFTAKNLQGMKQVEEVDTGVCPYKLSFMVLGIQF